MKHRHSRGREVTGILLLDKPSSMTSNGALQVVKRLFRARKAGHTGSLDPLATGLLPICFGEATKLSGFLLEADKSYRAVVRLGERTTTGDSEGEVIRRGDTAGIDRARVEQAAASFRGELLQIPPMHSAIKQNGVPLYKLAHQGIEVERKAREVTIHRFEVVDFSDDRVTIEVDCSKGTYIRVLADELGELLGCGGHICELRRTGVGAFDASRMVTMEALQAMAEEGGEAALDACLVSMESALAQWPDVRLSKDVAYFLVQGQPVFVPHAPSRGLVRIYTGEDRFLGVGHILDDGRVAPKRLVNQ
ncbi:MAG: tRNA pseudouridine(55) synthase TruB [Gammaproteobacteria bacterium]|jgi:tRNA pseudouridine55 synthase|nr:tRNA pseudouridine(55) synthase TruB [Gammaproteobacteria bacterium]